MEDNVTYYMDASKIYKCKHKSLAVKLYEQCERIVRDESDIRGNC